MTRLPFCPPPALFQLTSTSDRRCRPNDNDDDAVDDIVDGVDDDDDADDQVEQLARCKMTDW